MDIRPVQDGETISIVVAQPLFEAGIIEVGIKGVLDSGSDVALRLRTSVKDQSKRDQE
jgi:hypothetical protein